MEAVERQPELPLLSLRWPDGPAPKDVVSKEWLVTNGLGGYAAGTVADCPTRRYHGLFVPALEGYGRTVMLARMNEEVHFKDNLFRLDTEERADGSLASFGLRQLRAFRLVGLIPEWDYDLGELKLQRRLTLVHSENTLFLQYRHKGGPSARLRLRPYPVFRPHDQPVGQGVPMQVVRIVRERLELMTEGQEPAMKVRIFSPVPAPFISLPARSAELGFPVEAHRGYPHTEIQHSPGYFECTLNEGQSVAIGITTEGWETLDRHPDEVFKWEWQREHRLLESAPDEARVGTPARLVLSADQFIIEPKSRPKDEAWARAVGQDARSVIAGYHWFTDWGRDTMISLEGLGLCTGRNREAAAILRTFQRYVREGLIPNLFPEGQHQGLYHTADATLWYFHALDRYVGTTGDRDLLRDLFPTLENIVSHHLKGTLFNIGVDSADGLLRQGAEGLQLTWMDAKVEQWVVTPRRGKAVEINALWFNALRLMTDWAAQLGEDAKLYASWAEKTQVSFNRRFWNPKEHCLYDVVDGESGDDPAVRPNQIFALSLANPVLRKDYWQPVLQRVQQDLLTPVGLRSLSPSHPDYKPTYDGDLRARDASYHQGTVWAWLIGHFINAHLRVHADKGRARSLLSGLEKHLEDACLGQVSEIFDATPPYHPRGCVAQAWSTAEMLRAWLLTG